MTKLVDDLAYQTAELLCSVLLTQEGVYTELGKRERRPWLYIWEKRALLALEEYRKRKTSKPLNNWTVSFLLTNLENIKNDTPIDWNLRAAREKREALEYVTEY